ncbi:hypothetical protein [Parasitella parasitica]|uniref:Uncharacterized protein n=1 Tax=Parasitella parasitica TaxID=35722 RepID=A0A0B7NFH8_9FUNG|nr:hypothetical protein [Parasitella parasitica]
MVLTLEAPMKCFTRYYCFFKSAQFEGMSFADNKELDKILREQILNDLILTMGAQARRDSYTPAAPTELEDRETPCRVQGRPNEPPPTSTFHPLATLEFAEGSQGTQGQDGNAVSSAATQPQQDNVTAFFTASTLSFQSGETPASTVSTDSEAVSATSDGQISPDLGQQGAQTDGTEPSILGIQSLIYFGYCWILLRASNTRPS